MRFFCGKLFLVYGGSYMLCQSMTKSKGYVLPLLWISYKTGRKLSYIELKGCGMGTLFVLVSPCFRENEVVTYKIGSFLCSLDYTSEKRNCFLFWKSNFKMALIWKRAIFDLLFTFFNHQGKVTKIPSAHISLTYIHVFCSPYWLFCLTNFEKNTNLSGTVSLWYESWCWFLFAPFRNNQ